MPQTSTMLLPNSYTYMPQDVQDCRLPGLKPSKRFRRPPRQQLLQLLHAPAICFSGGSRLPFARPQTSQTLLTLPQASKATTLTATLCQLHAPDIYHAPAELLHLHAPGRSKAGQTAVLNPLKNRWQGHVVAVRVVALEACGSVWRV